MARYLLGRLAGIVVVLFIVSVVIFLLMHAIPGGPFDEDKVPLSPAAKANYLAKYGLDKPLPEQYVRYMANALRGDFGVPFQSPTETVTGLIGRTWPVSAMLGLVTLLVALPLGFLLGVLAAMRQNTWVDYVASSTATLGLTVPNFVVAVWLVLLFAVQWRLLPTGGWGEWYHYILPVAALALAPLALTARYTRISILEVGRADYIRTARAKGLAGREVWFVHALRNALIPLMTVLGPALVGVLGGAVVVETIFAWPGMGRLTINAVFQQDYPLVLGSGMFFAVLTIIGYLLSDIFYALVDPRVRLD